MCRASVLAATAAIIIVCKADTIGKKLCKATFLELYNSLTIHSLMTNY